MEGAQTLAYSAEEPSGVEGAECQESWLRNWGDPTRSLGKTEGTAPISSAPAKWDGCWDGESEGLIAYR